MALVLAMLLAATSWGAPVGTAASSVAANVKQALKLGKRADRTAKQALRTAREAKSAAKAGPTGPPGATGAAGAAGGQGERGLTGPRGAAGSGLGYAQIEYCGVPTGCEDFPQQGWFSSDDTNSPGIDNTVNFQFDPPPPAGIFCYHDLAFTPHVVMATIGTMGDPAVSMAYLVQGRAGSTDHPLSECGFPTGTDPAHTAAVYVRNMSGNLVEPAHDFRLFVLFG